MDSLPGAYGIILSPGGERTREDSTASAGLSWNQGQQERERGHRGEGKLGNASHAARTKG